MSARVSGVGLAVRLVVVWFVVLLVFGCGLAWGSVGWWHLGSGSRPSYLRHGAEADEVEQIVVSATGGAWKVQADPTGGFLATTVGELPFDATAGEVQGLLENELVFGAGNVGVEERSSEDTPERHVWRLTLGGALAGAAGPVWSESCSLHAGARCVKPVSLTGGAASVTGSVLSEGKADGELVATAENLGDGSVFGGGCVDVGPGAGGFSSEEECLSGEGVGAGKGEWERKGCVDVGPGAGQFSSEEECVNSGEAGVGAGEGEWERTTVRVFDVVPAGLRAVEVSGTTPLGDSAGRVPCKVVSGSLVSCEMTGTLPPFGFIEVRIGVDVTGGVPQESVAESENVVSVEGGQAASARISRPVKLSGEPVPFGVEDYELVNEEEGGGVDVRAGSHPFQSTLTLNLNETADENPLGELRASAHPVALSRDLHFKWPPGLIGNPLAVAARCSIGDFLEIVGEEDKCPADAAVGVARVSVFEPTLGVLNVITPLFDLEPEAGEPARFGFVVLGNPVLVDVSVRSGEDYGVTVKADEITQTIEFLSSSTTVWGNPGAAAHAGLRGFRCFSLTSRGSGGCVEPAEEGAQPFLALPTSCQGPVSSVVEGDSWPQANEQQARGETPSLLALASTRMPGLDGCQNLPFSPQIRVAPDTSAGSSSSGVSVDVHVPQQESVNGQGLVEGYPRDITVALPEGVAINPSGGDGLQACSEGLAGFRGRGELETIPGTQTLLFAPSLPGSIGSSEALDPGVNFCPDASKIATAKIKTPILAEPIEGAVYLATQNENPFGSLIAMYIIAEDRSAGVLVRLAGQVHLTGTGQIVTTFEDNPQAPFEDAELHFFGGERAPLATPAKCGTYTTTASFTPWSGTPPVSASSTFAIASGPNGSPCPGGSLPFSPSFTGGSIDNNAGAFTDLSTTISREDGQQSMQSVVVHMPPGLSGVLTGVRLCPEEQANAGTCPAESLIGETTVSAGVGSDPVSVTGGKVYLTEKYAGAPFGLSIVNPVKAGPFDLEHDTSNSAQQPACDCVVVRAKLEFNPTTVAFTATTDPSGPHAIPRIIDGIPVQIRKVNVTIDRPHFTFNPTNCDPAQVTGQIDSSEGATQTFAVPFQPTNCATLKFAPTIRFSTSGRTSKRDGASLTTTVTYPPNQLGAYANIAKVKVDLPKALPSRLTTLQKACLAATFEANPAACPAASIIGHAKAITPLLPVPLEGPAYFVSHGNEAFPSLTIVLQGYGIEVVLVGSTLIHKGITSTTFKQVPDQPASSFTLTLPQGPYSALAANTNLCKTKLHAPTAFVAQNGQEIHQQTPIAVTGCPKPHKKHHKKHATRHHKKHKK